MPTKFEVDAVEKTNDRFYRAMENGNLDEMSEIWLHEDWVKCVYPGWDLVIGWEKIRESMIYIFTRPGGMSFTISEVDAKIEADFAWVTCYEDIVFTLDSGSTPITARMTATNLYMRIAGSWRMIHHHSSQVSLIPMMADSETVH
ncbi:MAG TPA: nuclear transport factor 2 family protein [Blastocatellia bacterium]|nr:nuclear transport factor 2 family protein [Blastocatellia bacterium]